MKKINNGGYTLMELIVVIAIMAVLAASVLISFSVLLSTDAKKSADELSAMLSECRVDAMSRSGSYYLKIYESDGKISGAIYQSGEETALRTQVFSGRKLTVTWSMTGETTQTLTPEQPLYIAFDRATGGVSNCSSEIDGAVAAPTECVITVTGGSKICRVTLDTLTGSHTVKG